MKPKSIYINETSVSANLNVSWTISNTAKRTLIYCGSFLLVIIVTAYISASFFAGTFGASFKFLFAYIFFLFGWLHIFLFPGYLFHLEKKRILYTFLFALMTVLLTWLIFSIAAYNEKYFAVSAGAAFLLPQALAACHKHYKQIPSLQYKGWSIPVGPMTEKRQPLLVNTVSFKMKMKRRSNDKIEKIYTLSFPPLLTLGDVFRFFLLTDEEGDIELADNNNSAYAWVFLKKQMLTESVLDPNASLQYNSIHANDTIIITRVKKPIP